jgi:hypothetical protein
MCRFVLTQTVNLIALIGCILLLICPGCSQGPPAGAGGMVGRVCSHEQAIEGWIQSVVCLSTVAAHCSAVRYKASRQCPNNHAFARPDCHAFCVSRAVLRCIMANVSFTSGGGEVEEAKLCLQIAAAMLISSAGEFPLPVG